VIDSHCHIAGPEFADELDDVIGRAREAGLSRALVILAAEDGPERAQAAEVARRWPDVRFSIGVHPQSAGTFADDPAAAGRQVDEAIEAEPLARGLGEIGLDYHYERSSREVQQQVFREQIRVARRRRLPIVIHTREAEDDTFRILMEEAAAEVPVVFHCFTGDRDMARRALECGFFLSIAGIVTFPRALELKEVAKEVPLDRLLIETDSPFLAPVPYRGKRNEPAHVARVAEAIAELRGVSAAEIATATTATFNRIFNP
jgi:TatD DNase family protein